MNACDRETLLAAIATSPLPHQERADIVGLIERDQLGLARVAFAGCMAAIGATS